MREIFADNRDRINHALKTLLFAENIQAVEGGEPVVVKAAAILHEVSAKDRERILSNLGVEAQVKEKICAITIPDEKHADIKEFKILSDAHKLAEFQKIVPDTGKDAALAQIDASFNTAEGKKLAKQMLDDMLNTGKE